MRQTVAALQLPGKVWVGEAPCEPVRLLGSGVAAVDRLYGGGVRRGDVTEICGPRSSGRTALAFSLLAAATRAGEVVAVIDPAEALCPAALQTAGARLERVLWVRPPSLRAALASAELVLDAGGFGAVLLDLDAVAARRLPAHAWPRLRRAARCSAAALLVLSSQPSTGSFAGARFVLQPRRALWRARVFAGVHSRLTPQRGRAAVLPGGDLRCVDWFTATAAAPETGG